MSANAEMLINDLVKSVRTWPEKLKEEKKKGTKLIGYTGRFVPEELIYAAGAKPFLICRGGEPEPTEAVLPYMLRFLNPFVRAQLGYFVLGIDPVIPMLDATVLQCDDCHYARLADLFEYFKLPSMRLGIPVDWEKKLSEEYYFKGLVTIRKRLEEMAGAAANEEKLKASIESMNTLRSLLMQINLLRKEASPPIGGYDFIRLNHASFYGEVDTVCAKLTEIYEQLKKEEKRFSEKDPRILLVGRVVAVGDYVVPKLVEDSGGVLVSEFLDEGVRHCQWNVKTEGDLMSNLKETYFIERTPPSVFQPAWRKRVDYLKTLIKEFRVDGVIWYQLSFDEIYDMEYPIIAKSMEEINMPILHLESSYEYAREANRAADNKSGELHRATKGKRG